LARFLTKHLADPQQEAIVYARVRELRRDAVERATWADRVPSGWRALTIEDIARELSPEYAAAIKRGAAIRDQLRRIDFAIEQRRANVEAAIARMEHRWEEMGLLARALHRAGIYRDIDIEAYEKWRRRSENHRESHSPAGRYHEVTWGSPIRRKTLLDELTTVERQASAALNDIRPRAAAELKRRQSIAHNARLTLDSRETVALKPRRGYQL
jgi:hypothetical protein